MASSFLLLQSQPQGLPWYMWAIIALLVLGSLALIFVFYLRFKKTEVEGEEEWQATHSLFVSPPEPAATAMPEAGPPADEADETEDDIAAMRASLKPTVERPASQLPADDGMTRALTSEPAPARSRPVAEPTEPLALPDEEREPADMGTLRLASPVTEPEVEPPVEPPIEQSVEQPAARAPLPDEHATRPFTSERRAGRPTTLLDRQGTRPFDEQPPDEPARPSARVSEPSRRQPFEPPRIRPVNKREPFEPPRIEPVRPREGGAPPAARPAEALPLPQTRETAAPPAVAKAETGRDTALDEAAVRVPHEAPDVAAHPSRVTAGSILGLPAEGSRGPLVLGEPVLDRQEEGIRGLSRYGKDVDEDEGRGTWSMIVLGVVVLLLGGFVLAYAYIPGFKSRVTDFSARLRGLPPPSQQVPVARPKVRLFASAFSEKGVVKARGFVDNVSDETLENLTVEVSLESTGGATETRTVPVNPSPLAPFQRGQYEFQYDGKQFDSGYRVVRMTASSGEVGFTQPQR